ncbi:Tetratricopeptide repeat protein 30A, partial [Orchesella cincta]
IKEQQYKDAITVLEDQLELHANSRAALSLLGYCYFYCQDFTNAALAYERLVYLFPTIEEYRLYYAQALYHACMYNEAMDATCQVESPEFQGRILKLQAAIKYGADELADAKSLVDKCPKDDPDTEINRGCLLYKEGRYDEALQRFTMASQVIGYGPHLSYNIALTFYRLQNIPMAAKHIADIIQNEVSQHPEMGVGVTTEGIELPSVGNTLTLHETAFIEAFNLKAAFEFDIQNPKGAREALTDMPPRNEEELDAITLHNQAILNMEVNPTEGFEKLQFLLSQTPFPPETFCNLLLLYCKYECYDLAADVLADYAHLTYKYLTPFMYDFFDALITQQTSPEEAYKKFDDLANRTAEALRKLTKQVTEAKSLGQDALASKLCSEYDEMLASKYIPVLMAQAKIFWDKENYAQVEKIFRKSVEFCNEVDVWKLNVAHVIFMQENKFREAASFYEAIVKKSYNHVIDVSAIVLANLCVSYIMTGQNEEAEELMRKIEREEEQVAFENPDQKLFHLCIVNMVIGTLYCAKGNYDFGISRIIKSLEPYNKKLGTDTWFYAKRCFISMIEKGTKHVTNVRETVYSDCIQFLEHCEMYGRTVKTVIENPLEVSPLHLGKNTVTYEARLIKAMLLRLLE